MVRWRREKHKPKGGPSGGDGGKGGDVFIQSVRDLSILNKYSHANIFQAEDGHEGEKESRTGAGGEDLYIDLPIGSKVTNTNTGEVFQLTKEGQTEMILEGGEGGQGNEAFKSSVNQRPTEWTAGRDGEEADFLIELEIIADVGLVGLPSAGKSTLLNHLTNAQSKVGAYHFTTKEPHLGDLFGHIIADIPGLIEGASLGRGLGHTFLRHIKKTSLIVHCVSLESDDVARDYQTIRSELGQYDESLLSKPEKILLTKSDLADDNSLSKAKKSLSEYGDNIESISVFDQDSVKNFQDDLIKEVRGLKK